MNVMTISLSGEDVTLRLSAGKLQEFIKSGKNTEQTPLLAVLDALDTLERKAALLTAALQHKGNANAIKNGYDLLDELVDNGWNDNKIRHLIVDLAAASGLTDAEDTAAVHDAVDKGLRKFVDTVATVLAGENPEKPETPETPQEAEANPENPT